MVKDGYELDIYKIDTKAKIDAKKITIIFILIIAIIVIILAGRKIFENFQINKIYKQYETQLSLLQKQEEQKKAEEEKKRQEKLPKLTDEGRNNIATIYNSETKRAFLTFDDGPSAVTPTILDTLKQENIKATFFVLGSNVEGRQDMVKRMYDEGHYIANHGYTHIYSQIYASPEAVLNEYNLCTEKIRNAIGEQEYNPHLFRFPGGITGGPYAQIKVQADQLLSQNDILHVDWNALTGDAETNNLSIEFELARLCETIQNKNSVVILMHDAPAKSVTAQALPQIIAYLREQDYEFKNFYEIIK